MNPIVEFTIVMIIIIVLGLYLISVFMRESDG